MNEEIAAGESGKNPRNAREMPTEESNRGGQGNKLVGLKEICEGQEMVLPHVG